MKSRVVKIDEFMVKLGADFFEDTVQLGDVDDHPGARGNLAGQGDAQDIVMPVAVGADTFAEDPLILLRREFRIPVAVRGLKFDQTGEIVHSALHNAEIQIGGQ